jgi:formate--tetrahydrofolate ligase
VIVATAKAVARHDAAAKNAGLANLGRHIENIRQFGVEPVVAINRFPDDKPAELKRIVKFCASKGVEAAVAEHYAKGGKGAAGLAEAVVRAVAKNGRKKLKFLYPLGHSLQQKIETVAKKVYGAKGVDFDRKAENDLELLTRHGFGKLPICVAKTPLSFSDDAKQIGCPKNFKITVNELRISAGAGFVVVICGNILTMPGLPKVPAAARIKILPNGRATGLA